MQLFQFCAEHPGLAFTLTVLWHFWVAFALAIICIELHMHNSREEKNEFRRRFQEERRDSYAAAALSTPAKVQPPPVNPETRYMPKA